MSASSGDVTKIHSKYSFTLLTPSSYYISLAASVALAAATASVVSSWYAGAAWSWQPPAAAAAALAATQLVDARLIRYREYSKSLHMSLFGNAVWLAVCALGVAAFYALSRPEPPALYVALGAFAFASFRVGILTTTLGASLRRAWAMCMVQPLAMLAAMLPPEDALAALSDPAALAPGAALLAMASVWSWLTDRAGRPGIESTHRLVQAYLSSRGSDLAEIESIIEGRSSPSSVSTSQVRLKADDGRADVRLVLPEIHPGPYHPVGGSNITYRIYEFLGSSAMVMHSISDHALNLPSARQVERYLRGLSSTSVSRRGAECTEPVAVSINRARVTGLLFGRSPMLLLSMSPHGTEDLPASIKSEVEQYSRNRGFESPMVVDCHNAMGGEISPGDAGDMLKAAKSCLDALIGREARPMGFGYANSAGMGVSVPDLGPGGLGVLCLRVGGSDYFLGWADSNNMENGVRELIVERLAARGIGMLEVSTSDTHFSQTMVRTRQGYYQFGIVTPGERIAGWYAEIAERARAAAGPASFEILENRSQVKVMGSGIFGDYTRAIDRSLMLSKAFMAGSVALVALTLLL